MNGYKKIIQNKELRLKILQILSIIPDKLMIQIQYRIKTGHILNLKNPQRYTEKIQWYKLNYKKEEVRICSDKYAVRQFVAARGLSHILNTLYAVYDSPDEIDFDSLPNSFAMKMTVGSGMNFFIEDKSRLDKNKLRCMATNWFRMDSYSYGREWCYCNAKPRIMFEALLPMDNNNDLPDYKFFCFNGEPFCLYTMINYTRNHENGQLGFFDTEFKLLPYYRKDFKPITKQIEKPKNFEEMLQCARILSAGFPHVRVDLYNMDGKIVFGELTFYNASGYTIFEPDKFDYIMGRQFILPEEKK